MKLLARCGHKKSKFSLLLPLAFFFVPPTSGVEMLAPYIKTLLILESSPSLFFPIALSSDFTKIFSSTFNLSSHFLNFTELREASSLYRFLIHPLTSSPLGVPFPFAQCHIFHLSSSTASGCRASGLGGEFPLCGCL